MVEPNAQEILQRILESVRKPDYESLLKLSEFISRLGEDSPQDTAPGGEGGEKL